MKTIEERVAEIFADRFCTRCPKILYTTCDRILPGCCRIPEVRCMHEVIKNAIASEREELPRWNAVKESLPSDGSVVLCKYHNDEPNEVLYCVCQFVSGWFYTSDNNSLDEEDEPTHWREIHQ